MTTSTTSAESEEVRPLPKTVGSAFTDMPLTRSHLLFGSILFITYIIEAWEQVGLVYVSNLISDDFGVSLAQVGTALGVVALGMVPGTMLWAGVVERIGKKNVSILSLALYGLFALIAACSTHFGLFVVLRFLSGMAFGGVYSVTFPYFMELLPLKRRGQATVALSMGFPVGTLLCIAVSLLFGSTTWRIVALIAAFAAVWAVAVWKWLPESPYWLVKRGRQDEAKAVLHDLGAEIPPNQELILDPEDAGEAGRADNAKTVVKMNTTWLMTLLLVISFCYNWGYWGLQSWLPVLLQDKGLTVSGSLGFVALSQLFAVPGYLLAAWSTKRFGRRWVFLTFAVGATVGALLFGTASGSFQMYLGNIMFSFFILGSWGIWNTWSGEALPTKIRGVGYAASTAALLLSSAVAVPVVGAMMDAGWSSALVVGSIAAFMAVAVVLSFWMPETEGRTLR
jgi:putative MFS transporter